MPEPEVINPPPVEPVTPPPVAPANSVSRAQYESDMTKARSDEKQKQFDRIKKLEDELQQARQEFSTLKGQFDALTAAQSQEGKVDTKKLIEEVTTAANKLSDQRYADTQKELEALRRENANERLERFRQKAIADAGGPEKLVVSLVRGNTEEEISASIIEAKTEYEKIAQRFAPPPATPLAQTPAAQNPATVTPPPPIVPAGPGGEGRGTGESIVDTPGAVKQLSQAEFKEKREQIHKDLKQRYPRKAA